jgi:ssDNA-binding Zn-finger/Zn-ribbon topoisomerase 1
MAWFDNNKRLVCPNCHKSDGVGLVWSGGSSYFGQHEEDFVCNLCKCEFTVKYKVAEIITVEEGQKND